jgi:hypothetical protein
MSAEFGKVFARWVAFMLGKTILRVEQIALEHEAVTLDFGNNAGSGYAEAYAITANQRGLGARKIANRQPIDQGMGRARQQLFDYCAHPGVRCAKDIQAVDFLRGDCDGGPANFGIRCDLGIESFTGLGGEFFGVIEPTQNKVRREDDCAYNDRASEWSTTCLIDSCNGSGTQCG